MDPRKTLRTNRDGKRAARMRDANRDAVAFFHDHAGWSYDPRSETPEEGRMRCARGLAAAEAWASNAGVRYEWRHESEPVDRSGIEHDGPLWEVLAHLDGQVVGSCGVIDLGRDGDPWHDPYARVCEADLAADAMRNAEG